MNIHHKLNYIEFFANDLSVVKEFYTNAFGWKFTDFGPEYTAFNDGNMDGGFAKGEVVSEGGALAILFSDNLEESQKVIEGNDGEIVKPIFSFPGGRRFHFKDPVGNELAVWSDK